MARPANTPAPAHGLPNHPYLHILTRDAFASQLCGSRRNLEVHHILCRSRGGDDSDDNLLTLCAICHAEVHTCKVTFGPSSLSRRSQQ